MLKLRLARVGKRKHPFYRLVVSDKSKDMYGDHLENLGNFNPHNKEVVLKSDRIKHWLSVGAQMSATVQNLLVKQGLIKADKVKAKSVSITKRRQIKIDSKKPKSEEKVAAPVAETPVVAPEITETPVATEEQK